MTHVFVDAVFGGPLQPDGDHVGGQVDPQHLYPELLSVQKYNGHFKKKNTGNREFVKSALTK